MTRIIAAFILLPWSAAAASAIEQSFDALAEMQLDVIDADESWTTRGLGKLRDGNTEDDLETNAATRFALDYRAHFGDTVSAHLVLDAYSGVAHHAGLTEGWLTWSPVPRSEWQHRLRAGAYIPPFSLEHTGTGWTSPYMPTASVLNSWVGEELHVAAIEHTMRHLGAMAGSPHTFTLRGALFSGNDTSGTLLSWRGWAPNDRVTPRGELLPLPHRAAFEPDATFPGLHDTDPFVDLDGRPGYYLVGEWRYANRVKLLAGHYDNRADPLAFADGQAGWRTRFQVLGVHYKPAHDVDVLAQFAAGNTFVGRRNTQRSVDNDFSAAFLLLRRTSGAHRFSGRIEIFEVTDEDPNLLDDNREQGDAWALAWQYTLPYEGPGDITAGIEYLAVRSERPERAFFELPVEILERQLRLMLRASF